MLQPCATAVDVNTAELPSTPCLIMQGDMMKPSGWLLSIEGHVVMGPHPFFLHGVAAFFSSYYVFNLEYPAAGSSTLEFIQRCFLGINPERGSKTKKRTTMNPHKLCSLSIFTYGYAGSGYSMITAALDVPLL
ncbi:hypothetical protein Q8A67_000996 [Cirrhinus molitorella]|uniref:Uncharacterized protein n=1 Tax=Cirrhinus molitorella TaxID=172907 RepID=A0AA88QDP0_9TELE|nr:hypothetical protein Q8A67_000996 [Cirrhinus molitorella]